MQNPIKTKTSICSRLFNHNPADEMPTIKRIGITPADRLVVKVTGFAIKSICNAILNGFA
ncbi:hypothetical protein [Vibrio splendidus]|uniref:hypothetical protein n=1 Tax=Vibrio splendidus TaxID=29497 RepID=UPI003D1303B0